MPIIQAELKLYKAQTINDGGTNGGRMSANEITSGAMANVFPTVGEAERAAGSTKYRKVFMKVANDDDLTLLNPQVFLDNFTPGDDRVEFFAGNQTNTQSAITGSETKYGCGKLDQNVSAGAASVDVLVEDGATQFFQNGQTIRITDKTDVDDVGGNEEYVVISTTPSVVGNIVTLTFAPVLQNGYSSSLGRVMNVYEPSDVVSSFDTVNVTSASGTFDENYLFADNIGTVEQDWTITFSNATTFTISGDTVGSVGGGNIGSGASPSNTDFSKPYFVIQAAAFGGTFTNGDTITFSTRPASVPVWLRRIVPAGAANLTVNEAVLAISGETSGV